MKEEWFSLYESMLQEMGTCREFKTHLLEEIECCFNFAQRRWSQVQLKLENHVFLSKFDEIDFYKRIKPLFKSQTEYYNLLYQAEILKPADLPGEMKEFWIKEQQKLDRFIQDNQMMYAYYKNGSTNRDEEFFYSRASENENGRTIYHDDLIATLLALEKYSTYAQSELSRL
ncbi:MAG: RteC domain-containing protein [Puia sp.]